MPTYTTPRNSLTLALTNGVRYIFRVRTVIDGQEYTSEYSPPSTVSSSANGSGVQVDQDLDIGTGKILYSNVYDTLADLPAAADYHGMFAHVHNYDGLGTGAAFYGHAGNWVRLADSDDVPTQFVSGVNGVAGAITLAAGSGTQISQVGNQLTISSTQTFTTLNGEAGDLTLVGGENIQISTQDGLITVSGNDSSTVNGLTGNVAIVAGPNINVATTGQNVVISGEQGGIQWVSPSPSSPSDPGNVGDVAYDNSFLYVYTAQGWRRASLGAWNPDITITTQPQDLLLGVGGSGNFTIAATVSDGSTPNYQWQNSDDNGATWDTITGATGTSYGLSAVSLADNGTLYRAVVSATGAVNVTSDSATLAVGETSRLLTASNDTLLTETGDALNHDGGGGNDNPTNDWEQAGVAFDTQGLVYAYSADADIAYGWTATTSSNGYNVHGLQRYERTNGAWVAVGSTRHTGATLGQTPLPIAVSSDGSRVIAVSQASQIAVDRSDYGFAGYRVYDYANQTLTVAYSGTQDDFDLAAMSGDGSVWAAHYYSGGMGVYSSAGLIGTVFSDGPGTTYSQHLAINYDGTWVAFSGYGDVTGDGNADAYTRVFQWTGTSWSQMGGNFVSPANVLSGMPRQPVAFSSDGSRIAIGYSTDTANALTQCGVVRVYDWTGSAWVQAGSDLAGASPYEFFGSSLSLSSDGTRLAIGAIGDDSSATNSGRSVVYQYSAGGWFQVGADIDGPASTNAYAGSSSFLSGDGNYLGVGASGAETLTRYELQTNQITITQQPQDATYSGSPVTFSTLATVSDNSTPSYQWQTSADNGSTWVDVSNATVSNLTINSAVAGDDGDQYRAVISASRAPGVTTSAVTLTVT